MIDHSQLQYEVQNNACRWYALRTKAKHEKKVDRVLKEKGIDSYLPLNVVYRRWSDRYKKIHEPMFSCYVFVYMLLKDRLSVLQTQGAVNFVTFNGAPAPIPDKQIISVKKILENEANIEQANYFTRGTRVRIRSGILQGIEGQLLENGTDKRLVIGIDGIKQAISITIKSYDIELI